MAPLPSLPAELWHKIFGLCSDHLRACRIALVCKQWRSLEAEAPVSTASLSISLPVNWHYLKFVARVAKHGIKSIYFIDVDKDKDDSKDPSSWCEWGVPYILGLAAQSGGSGPLAISSFYLRDHDWLRFLCNFKRLTSLHVEVIERGQFVNWAALQHLPQLKFKTKQVMQALTMEGIQVDSWNTVQICPQLTLLNLSRVNGSGDGVQLRDLTNLRSLSLCHTDVHPDTDFTRLTALTALHLAMDYGWILAGDRRDDLGVPWLTNLQFLRQLSLQLGGEFRKYYRYSLGTLSQLTTLNICGGLYKLPQDNGRIGKEVLGEDPQSLKWMGNIKNLCLVCLDLGMLGRILPQCTSLISLRLSNNGMQQFPAALSSCSQLSSLDLGRNRMQYRVSDIGMLQSLQSLQVIVHHVDLKQFVLSQKALEDCSESLQLLKTGKDKKPAYVDLVFKTSLYDWPFVSV